MHTSLLPRWRGAAPIQYAILHGDTQTGVTTMFMDERMDTGDIILQRTEPIREDDTSTALQDRLATLSAGLLVETVSLIDRDRAPRARQDDTKATYAKKLAKEEGRIDWTRPATWIERQLRAFDPWPSAYTFWGDTMLKLLKADVVKEARGKPGEILPGCVIATGDSGLKIRELQPAGKTRMSIEAFLRGHQLKAGSFLH